MHRLDWWVALCLVAVSVVGPWTVPLSRLFALSEFERVSVVAMASYMAQKIPKTFALGFHFFVLVPMSFIGLRFCAARRADMLQSAIAIACEIVSIVALPLLWIYISRPVSSPNVMADVFVMDLVTMYLTHVAFIFGVPTLQAWTLACGPLFGMARYLRIRADVRPSSILGSVAALFVNIGGLYRAYMVLDSAFGLDVFTFTVPFYEWQGYELYAAVNVIFGFVLLCASTPAPATVITRRGCAELIDVLLYVILLNANVAAAWIATRGVWRPSSVAVKRIVWRESKRDCGLSSTRRRSTCASS